MNNDTDLSKDACAKKCFQRDVLLSSRTTMQVTDDSNFHPITSIGAQRRSEDCRWYLPTLVLVTGISARQRSGACVCAWIHSFADVYTVHVGPYLTKLPGH